MNRPGFRPFARPSTLAEYYCSAAMKGMLVAILTIVSVAYAGDEGTDQRIRALIDKLAISEQPASKEPLVTYNNPRNAELVKQVHSTANELEKFGMAAFPHLIAHLDDSRQSVPFSRVLPSTVGDACLSIAMRQIYALPDGYSDTAALFRRGADGKLHEQPVWSRQIYDGVGVHKWLTDRKGKTLRELQLEAVEWVLKTQKEIGARTIAERDEYIAPLEAQVARLRRGQNQTVQRTGASRFPQRQIQRHWRLAPVADLFVSLH